MTYYFQTNLIKEIVWHTKNFREAFHAISQKSITLTSPLPAPNETAHAQKNFCTLHRIPQCRGIDLYLLHFYKTCWQRTISAHLYLKLSTRKWLKPRRRSYRKWLEDCTLKKSLENISEILLLFSNVSLCPCFFCKSSADPFPTSCFNFTRFSKL